MSATKTTATTFREDMLGQEPMTDIIPVLAYIAHEWKLNLNNAKDFKIAKKIVINSIKNN